MESPTLVLSNTALSPANFPAKLKFRLSEKHFETPGWKIPGSASVSACNARLREKIACSVSPGVGGKINHGVGVDPWNGKGRWIHFVGVGGCGLSALAKLALKRGFNVSGSDIVRSSFMDGLYQEGAGAQLCIGHSISNIQSYNGLTYPDLIVMSSAISPENSEVLYAKSVGIPVYKRDYWLGKITENHNLIAVSGSHGKSTTAAMLAYVLKAMGDDVAAIVGAHVPQFPDGNIIAGNGQNFVLEADEYDGCFLGVSPRIAVVTNLDWEHVDQFSDEEAVKTTFRRFLNQIREGGNLILCGDSPGACSLLDCGEGSRNRYRITTYGSSITNEWHASFVRPNAKGGSDYTLLYRGLPVAEISLRIAGVHNVLNSMAVIATLIALFGDQAGFLDLINQMRSHLANFSGISRRFEKVGSAYGCHIYDDYAHHPTEICAVLKAARDMFPLKTLIVIFQPHTYSRLAALIDDFAAALQGADRVFVTEVYAAREKNVHGVDGRDLALRISGIESEYVPFLDDVVDKLVLEISKDPYREILILTLGAGDITTLGPRLLPKLMSVNPPTENVNEQRLFRNLTSHIRRKCDLGRLDISFQRVDGQS